MSMFTKMLHIEFAWINRKVLCWNCKLFLKKLYLFFLTLIQMAHRIFVGIKIHSNGIENLKDHKNTDINHKNRPRSIKNPLFHFTNKIVLIKVLYTIWVLVMSVSVAIIAFQFHF